MKKNMYLLLILCFIFTLSNNIFAATCQDAYKYTNGIITSGYTDYYTIGEPNVIYEDGTWDLFARTCTENCGVYDQGGVKHWTSSNGINWTKVSDNYVITGYQQPNVVKMGSEYWMYATKVIGCSGTARCQIDLYISTDKNIWTLDTADVIPLTEGSQYGNHTVWKEEDTYHMVYEYLSGDWVMGRATSPTGKGSWTKHGGITMPGTTGAGGPFVKKVDSTYYLFYHGGSPAIPSDIYVCKSTDLVTWTGPSGGNCQKVISRTVTWEGLNSSLGQVADTYLVSYGNSTYMYYTGQYNQGPYNVNPIRLGLAIIPIPTDTVAHMNYFLNCTLGDWGGSMNLGLGGGVANIGGSGGTINLGE